MNNDSNQDKLDKLPKRQEKPDESGSSGGLNMLDISKDSKKAEQTKSQDTGKDSKRDIAQSSDTSAGRTQEAFDKAAKDGKSVQAIAKSGKKIKEGLNRLPANWKKHAQTVMSQTVQILVQQHGAKNQTVAKAALNYTAGGGEEENKIIQLTSDPNATQDPDPNQGPSPAPSPQK